MSGDQAVGYRKNVGRAAFFSRDGYAFSGRPIACDRAVAETPLRTFSGHRVFSGDVVELRPAPNADFEERLVVEDASGLVTFAKRGAGRLECPGGGRESLRGLPVRRRLGSVYTDAFFRKEYAPALDALLESGNRYLRPALRLAAAVLLGGALSVALQLWVSASVGPLTVALGSLIAVAAAAFAESRVFGHTLRGTFLHRVAVRAAPLNGIVLAGAWIASSTLGATWIPRGLDTRFVGAGAAAALGFFATYALIVVAGSSLDHYAPGKPAPAPRMRVAPPRD